MRFTNLIVFLASLCFLPGGMIKAQNRLPDALAKQAPVICNGVVLSVTDLGPEKEHSYQWAGSDSRFLAKIKILHIFKGSIPSEIEFRYWVHPVGWQYLDGDDKVSLAKGNRCRFFLRPTETKGRYIGELEAEGDPFDIYDVEPMSASEPDNNPFLSQKDALSVAREYLKGKGIDTPEDSYKPQVDYGISFWMVSFFPMPASSGILRAAYRVCIRMDRTIDPTLTKSSNNEQ